MEGSSFLLAHQPRLDDRLGRATAHTSLGERESGKVKEEARERERNGRKEQRKEEEAGEGEGEGGNCRLISNYSRAATRVTSLDLCNINTPTEGINRVQP